MAGGCNMLHCIYIFMVWARFLFSSPVNQQKPRNRIECPRTPLHLIRFGGKETVELKLSRCPECPMLAAGTTDKRNVMIGVPQVSHRCVLSESHLYSCYHKCTSFHKPIHLLKWTDVSVVLNAWHYNSGHNLFETGRIWKNIFRRSGSAWQSSSIHLMYP